MDHTESCPHECKDEIFWLENYVERQPFLVTRLHSPYFVRFKEIG